MNNDYFPCLVDIFVKVVVFCALVVVFQFLISSYETLVKGVIVFYLHSTNTLQHDCRRIISLSNRYTREPASTTVTGSLILATNQSFFSIIYKKLIV